MPKPPSNRKKATSAVSSNSTSTDDLVEENISPQEDPGSATITVTAVEIPELTEEEQSDRLHLERKVEKAVFEAGKALMELRDRRLYRSTHSTFEEYCKDRFGFERRHPYRLIEAAAVVDNLMQICFSETQTESESNEQQLRPIGTQILPTSERQVRPMTKLEPQEQQEVWLRAVELAGGKVPTGRIVKDVVQKIMERTKVPNTYQLGEVCTAHVDSFPIDLPLEPNIREPNRKSATYRQIFDSLTTQPEKFFARHSGIVLCANKVKPSKTSLELEILEASEGGSDGIINGGHTVLGFEQAKNYNRTYATVTSNGAV
ncbi:AIPR family protein [Nostoc sp. CHAB 5715]|nr:AIPR family protein [Nostoc sp. CHAB 5715]MCC5622403.1 AIPR family protein [Nostoc sp. CHAB 5715]